MDRYSHLRARVARLALLPLVAVALNGWSVEAQTKPASPRTILRADDLYFGGLPEKAYGLLRDHLEAHPSDYDALWRAARAAVRVELTDEAHGAQYRWLDPAIEIGDLAVAERPDGIEGLYWRGVAEGRRALYAGDDYAAELAERVLDDAHSILALDSLHGGAHNMLGNLNYEIMDLSRIERFLARLLSNNRALDNASWEAAELHLRRATELWPEQVLFHLDLARLYERRGREDAAEETLRHVLTLPSVHPADEHLKDDARRLLEELVS